MKPIEQSQRPRQQPGARRLAANWPRNRHPESAPHARFRASTERRLHAPPTPALPPLPNSLVAAMAVGSFRPMTPPAPDEIRKTTCYMCACRCGIDVHIAGRPGEAHRGQPRPPGQPAASSAPRARPASCSTSPPPACARRSAAPARAARASSRRSPGTRRSASPPTGSRRSARSTPRSSPSSPAATSRRRFTGWWAQQFGTPNYAAHGGFCSVNMAAAGIYTLGGAFWEFGSPDWERTKLLLLFGVAEDHDSNPIKIGLGKLKARGARVVSINPVRTGYSAIADQWLGITPGTDGLLVLSLIHCLLTRRQDRPRPTSCAYTNAAWLVDQGPRSPGFGSFLRDGRRPRAGLGPRPPQGRPARHAGRQAGADRHLQHRPDPRQAGLPADDRGLPRPRPRAGGRRPGLRPRPRRASTASPPILARRRLRPGDHPATAPGPTSAASATRR